MAEQERSEAERIIRSLKADGWKEQRSGTCYINGTIGTSLLKDGQVITVQQEFFPDEEFIEEEWPSERSGRTALFRGTGAPRRGWPHTG